MKKEYSLNLSKKELIELMLAMKHSQQHMKQLHEKGNIFVNESRLAEMEQLARKLNIAYCEM